MPDPGVAYLFQVAIDGVLLGNFTKISGLAASYEVETVKEGGENEFAHQLPGRVTYGNVTLTRPVDIASSSLPLWFSRAQNEIRSGSSTPHYTISIVAFGANHWPLASWTLLDAYPVKYVGPAMKAGNAEVLEESVELTHNGFWNSQLSASKIALAAVVGAGVGASTALSLSRDLELQSRAGPSLGGI